MEPSTRNEHGVYTKTTVEIVAQHDRSSAEIRLAYCDDGQYRFALSVHYSYGGFGAPVTDANGAWPSLTAARMAGLEALLARWPTAFTSEPGSVHEELRSMREQVASRLSQPTLF